MRKLSVFNAVSLDGYFTDADGDMSWAYAGSDDPEWQTFVSGNAKGGGALLLGRVTYEMMASYWPTAAAKAAMPAVADGMNRMEKFVASRTMTSADWQNTTVLNGDLVGAVKKLKASPGPDIAILGSGPRAGLAEVFLPELQKGSSIMPGKVNPVIPEVVLQVAAQVIGNDMAITVAGTQGNFELNVRVPMIARNLLESITILASGSTLLADKVIDGLEANEEALTRNAESTPAIATALNPHIGYDKATEIVKEAVASRRTIREVALEKGVDEATLDEALDLRKMARGSAA